MKTHHLNRRGFYVHPMATHRKPKILRGTTANNHHGQVGDKPRLVYGKPSRRQLEWMRV